MRSGRTGAVWYRALLLVLLLVLLPFRAQAHFVEGAEVRVVHFDRAADGLHAYFRMTLPLVVVDPAEPEGPEAGGAAPPYIWSRLESETLFYYADAARIAADPLGLGRLIAERHGIAVDGRPVTAEVRSVAVYPRGFVPPFNSLDEVRAASAGKAWPDGVHGDVDALDVLVDAHLVYPGVGAGPFDFTAGGTGGAIGRPDEITMLVDHAADGSTAVYRFQGPLDGPVRVNAGPLEAAWTFTVEGVRHILEGADHLLFVLCLTLGATSLAALVWRVSAFTLGHSVTLVAGALGWVPQVPWFIPAIETGIALSIIYAALAAALRFGERLTLLVVALIGLLHGFGFSFVLQEILQPDAPHLVLSLAAFNLGVELGQLAVVALLWPLLVLARRRSGAAEPWWRGAVAATAAMIALAWVAQRAPVLWASLA
ncbi:MAG: HupE/UreJ family protein [Geminicoccaceae bacterium]